MIVDKAFFDLDQISLAAFHEQSIRNCFTLWTLTMKMQLSGKLIYAIILVSLTISMSACQTVAEIQTISNKTLSFSGYQTVSFHPLLNVEGDECEKILTKYIKFTNQISSNLEIKINELVHSVFQKYPIIIVN